jgi:8-oxo-dGTP diphosphatase
MPAEKYVYEYPRPAVTVDVVIVARDAKPRVLLIRRKHEPFAGSWAIPGGLVDIDEPLDLAVARQYLKECDA